MEHLKKHTLDLVDWIDFRPPVSWWLIVLGAVVTAWLGMQLPPVMQAVVVAMTVGVTFLAVVLIVVGLVSLVAIRAALDTVRDCRDRPRAVSRSVGRVGLADR